MALKYINKIQVGTETYNIGTNSVLVFAGVTDNENLVNGYTGSITIGEDTYAPSVKGYVVMKGTQEFVSDGTQWVELGDEGWTIATTADDAVVSITPSTASAVTDIAYDSLQVLTGLDFDKLASLVSTVSLEGGSVGSVTTSDATFVASVTPTVETVTVSGDTTAVIGGISISAAEGGISTEMTYVASVSGSTGTVGKALGLVSTDYVSGVSLTKDVVTAVSANTAAAVTSLTSGTTEALQQATAVTDSFSVSNETLIIPTVTYATSIDTKSTTVLNSVQAGETAAFVTGVSATSERPLSTSAGALWTVGNTNTAMLTGVSSTTANASVIASAYTNTAFVTGVQATGTASALTSANLSKQVVTGVSSTTSSALVSATLDGAALPGITYSTGKAFDATALQKEAVLSGIRTLTSATFVTDLTPSTKKFLTSASKNIG